MLDDLDWFNHPVTSFFYVFFLVVAGVITVGMVVGCLLLGILLVLDAVLPESVKGGPPS